jgi:DNA repair exonuclease SbcCD ATPase subunit
VLDVKELTIEGFRSFGAEQKLTFRPGVFLLTGDNRDRGVSAGAGKSTIFKAITTALFERNDDDSIKDNGINTVRKDGGAKIGVSFIAGGVYYHVVYARKHPTLGTAWRLYRWDGAAWHEESATNVLKSEIVKLGDTGLVIGHAIGMTYDQFVNNAYIPQYRVAEFIERTDKERKLVFTRLLGLEQCDTWLATAKQLRQEAEKQVTSANARLEVLRGQVAQYEAGATNWESEKHSLVAQVATDKATQAAQQAAITAIEGEINVYNAIKAVIERTRWIKQELDRQADTQAARTVALKKIKLPEVPATLVGDRRRAVELNYQLSDLRTRLSRVGKIGETCSECERPLTTEERETLTRKYTVLIASADGELGPLNQRIAEAAALETQLALASKQRNDAEAEIRATDQYMASLKTELEQLRKHGDGKLPKFDLDDRLAAKAAAKQACDEASARILAAEVRIRQLDDAQRNLTTLRAQIVQAQTAAETIGVRVACLKKTEEAIGDKGFRSYKINASCDTFNASLSKYLALLTNGEMQAWLVTQVPRADGKGMKQELDIIVKDGAKEGVPIRQYSGAEKAALSLSITGAFWDLAASQADCGVNLLLLDEPFANMDAWGKEQACRLFDFMRDDNRTVIVITNEPDLRERGHFDGEIRAVKEHDITRLEEYDLSGEH